MPLYLGTLTNNEKKYDRAFQIEEVRIQLFSTDLDNAEIALIKLCSIMFPELAVDSIYEVGFAGSDPTVT